MGMQEVTRPIYKIFLKFRDGSDFVVLCSSLPKYMTKKFGLSVVAATLLASGVQAAEVSAPHNNVSFWGGISASLTSQTENMQGNSETKDGDYFCLDTAVIGATVKADESNPFGGTVVAGNFAVKTVTGAKVVVKDPVTGESNFRTWLAHIDYIPVSNLMVNAGLLWQNFGEKPVDALNPHMTRTTDFVFQPVAMAGLRLTYDLGMAKVYAGLNDGSVLGGSHRGTSIGDINEGQAGLINQVATSFDNTQYGAGAAVGSDKVTTSTSGMEAGVHVGLEDLADIGVNYFSQSGDALSTMNASVTEKMTGFDIGLEVNQHTAVTMASAEAALDLNGVVGDPTDSAFKNSAGVEAFIVANAPVWLTDYGTADGAYLATTAAAAYDLSVNSMKLSANIKLADNLSIPVRYDTSTISLEAQQTATELAVDSYTINAITVTPTFNPTPASFVRAEICMTTSNEDAFADMDGKATDSRSTYALEFGVLF
jgi:hypothetical protein